jgi:hypothetical protein
VTLFLLARLGRAFDTTLVPRCLGDRKLNYTIDSDRRNHVALRLPLRTPVDGKALAELLPRLVPELLAGTGTLGAVHSSHFAIQDEETLLFLGDFDGEFPEFIAAVAKAAGPVFDDILSPVEIPSRGEPARAARPAGFLAATHHDSVR